MSIINSSQNSTLESTGRSLELTRNNLSDATSLIITTDTAYFTEDQLQDVDYMTGRMSSGVVFPIHKIFEISTQNKEIEYKESAQDFSYPTYRGKNINIVKFDLRPDYHYLLKQFEGRSVRVIYCMKNRKFLCKKDGTNYRGFLLSNINIEDIEYFTTNLSPIRLEHYSKTELDLATVIDAGYSIYDIDRRILNIEITGTKDQLNLYVKYLQTGITTIVSSDLTVNDLVNGTLTYSFTNLGLGYYKLTNPNLNFTSGCIQIESEIYIGRAKYRVTVEVTYTNLILMDGDDFVLLDSEGSNFDLLNTTD